MVVLHVAVYCVCCSYMVALSLQEDTGSTVPARDTTTTTTAATTTATAAAATPAYNQAADLSLTE